MSVSVSHIRHDGSQVLQVNQRSGEYIVRGKDRVGIRAGDWRTETSGRRHELDNPQVEKARILVETAEVVGADELTAQDIAIHEYLLACARKDGIDKPKHAVGMRQLCDFVGVAAPDRIWASLTRLQRTMVRYHITDPTTKHRVLKSMIECWTSSNRLTGKMTVGYSIPAVVREAILQSRSYTWLDINSFARFKCKYTGRLYPKLALMAGYDYRLRKAWTPTIAELAEFIGYSKPGEEIHYGSFVRVLDKALAELEEHVTRFTVECTKPVRSTGRGRPVEGTFKFTTTDAAKSLFACRAAALGPTQIGKIEDRRHSPLAEHEHPAVKICAQAQTLTGIEADVLSDRWRLNVADARLHPRKRFGAMTGEMLTSMLDGEGLRSAFREWIRLAVQLEHICEEMPEPTADTPLFAAGNVGGSWVESELWYAEGYDEEDEVEDLRTAGDYASCYDDVEPE